MYKDKTILLGIQRLPQAAPNHVQYSQKYARSHKLTAARRLQWYQKVQNPGVNPLIS